MAATPEPIARGETKLCRLAPLVAGAECGEIARLRLELGCQKLIADRRKLNASHRHPPYPASSRLRKEESAGCAPPAAPPGEGIQSPAGGLGPSVWADEDEG